MRRCLFIALLALGCESTALSLSDPSAQSIVFEPPFISGDVVTVSMRFEGLEDAEPCATERSCVLLDYDVGVWLGVESVVFIDNFELQFELKRFGGAPTGVHPLTFVVSNDYGTFTVGGDFYVF